MYYLEVFFQNNESIAIKSLIKNPSIEEVEMFVAKDIEKYGCVKKTHVIPLAEVEKFFDWSDIDNWPILTKHEEVPIRGAMVKQNYSDTGKKIQYGMDIQMHDDKYYGCAYYLARIGKSVFACSWEYKSFAEAYDKLSLEIIKHMNNHPVLRFG